jgi:hypothetical protein
MPANVAGWIGSNISLVIAGALALVAIAWAYESYEEAEDRREAVGGFAGRAKEGTGGALNVVLVTVVSLVGWAATTFQTAGEAVTFLITLAPEMPVLTASVFTISLGAIGLSDLIVLEVGHFILLSAGIVMLAVAYRADFGEVGPQ